MTEIVPDEAAAIWVSISKLKPWSDNPRKNEKAIDQVAKAIKRFGWSSPIVAREQDGEIIAGHTRFEAARQLGLERVPVRFLKLDPADAHLLAIADNRLGEIAKWDDDKLAEVLAALHEEDVDLTDGTGLTDAEIMNLLDDPVIDDDSALDRPGELQDKWRTEVGQVWEIPSQKSPGKSHRIICGDSTDAKVVDRLMQGEQAAWMWTDPPYGVNYVGKTADALKIENDGSVGLAKLLEGAFAVANGVLADGAPIYVSHPAAGPLALEFGREFIAVGWHLHGTLIWLKNSMVLGHSDYHYKHEPIFYGWKGSNRPWFGGRTQDSVLAFDRPSRSEEHPTTKPVALIEHCLANSSARGSLGFEPFAGSGSTLLAAENLGRICAGVEIDPKYVAVVLERMAALNPRLVK